MKSADVSQLILQLCLHSYQTF